MKAFPLPPVPPRIPRRKYGRMQKPMPVYDLKHCRFCRAGKPCPLHTRG